MQVKLLKGIKIVSFKDINFVETHLMPKVYDTKLEGQVIPGYIQIRKCNIIVSIEYPFDQDNLEHYANMKAKYGEEAQIMGDNHFINNPTVR
uniref:phosphopyruvate hydratase n=1 Tax=Lactuca sativa TaxID=4236 RepID=A0A9R1VHV0_LACSA|nr:hypothetical protein LSAT_V11C500252880 [Lactuca sativa]